MKHRIITAIIIAAIAACLLCGSVSAMTGSGTQANPYIISSQSDLALLSGSNYASYAGNNKYFELGADITMSGTFTPIGTNSYKFNGHFDGKGHSITGLKTSSNPSGLFMYVTSGAEFKNINFYNAQISGTGEGGTGVLYGHCYQADTKVTVSNINVYNSKITSSNGWAGGVAGQGADSFSQVEFTSCNVKGCVITSSSSNFAGGVVAYGALTSSQIEFTSCNVEDCVISCGITGSVGGVVGVGAYYFSQANFVSCHVKNCYLFANSPSTYNQGWCGGIAGCYYDQCTGSITGCTVEKCTIRSAWKYAGGIMGGVRGNAVTISNCAVSDSTIIAANSYGAGVCPQWLVD